MSPNGTQSGGKPPNTSARVPETNWTPAAETASSGDLYIGILLVEVEEHRLGNSIVIFVLAENRSDRRKIDFVKDLNQPARTHVVRITDDIGNKYHRTSQLNHPLLRLGLLGLPPNEFVIYALPALEVIDKAKYLYIDMSSLVMDSDERFKFKIPIKVEKLTYTPLLDQLPFEAAKPATRTVLFKRQDFESWFEKSIQRQKR